MNEADREEVRLVTNELVRMAGAALDLATRWRRVFGLPDPNVSEQEPR
jgi:hypothetical protein